MIDPLDGTINYIHGLPQYGISIGLEQAGEIVYGSVYFPRMGERFFGAKGQGAWKEERGAEPVVLSVSDTVKLEEAVVASGFPYDRMSNEDNNVREASILIPRVRGFRRQGAASWDIAKVAEGVLDAYWEGKVRYWDVAAGVILVREAGGTVSLGIRDIESGLHGSELSVLAAGALSRTLERELEKIHPEVWRRQR